jgi:hypothetical protein
VIDLEVTNGVSAKIARRDGRAMLAAGAILASAVRQSRVLAVRRGRKRAGQQTGRQDDSPHVDISAGYAWPLLVHVPRCRRSVYRGPSAGHDWEQVHGDGILYPMDGSAVR